MAIKTELSASPDCQTGLIYHDYLNRSLAWRLIEIYGNARVMEPNYERGLPSSTLKSLIDYIDTHLEQDMRLADLARLVNFSDRYISMVFKQSIGIPIHQYIIRQRVERAKRLLKSSQLSITEIALQCGFYSHSHLTRAFKRIVGVNPSDIR